MTVDAASRFLTVLAIVAGPGGLVVLAARRHPALDGLRRHALAAAASIAVTATAGSLWLSEVAGLVPCELCWWQRIAMYPLGLLLVVAAVRRDDAVRPYARVLAAGGLLVSSWHVLVQRVPAVAGASSCAADAPCTVTWFAVLGVFSIPVLAACGFVGVLALLALPREPDVEAADPTDPTDLTTSHQTRSAPTAVAAPPGADR